MKHTQIEQRLNLKYAQKTHLLTWIKALILDCKVPCMARGYIPTHAPTAAGAHSLGGLHPSR
jgi:hypothetical protein